jgi:PST family polysaccharide transporter
MKDKFIGVWKNHKSVVTNFSYLSLLQIINKLVPLATYPYLIRVLGDGVYGLVIYAQAIIQYLLIVVTFGFNVTGTKHISANRNDKEKIGEIVSSIFIIKTTLLLLVSALLFGLIYTIPALNSHKGLYVLMLWMCVYDVLFPIWYFQGIEKMSYITLATAISRFSFLGLIFLFVKNESDYLMVPIINGVGAITSAFISLGIILIGHKIKLKVPHLSVIKFYFLDSLPIFFANIASRIYTSSNKVIIGSLIGMSEVAIFDLAEKIINLFKIPQQMIITASFPKVVANKSIRLCNNICRLSFGLNVLLFIFIIITGSYMVKILGGDKMESATSTLFVLALVIPLYGISNSKGPIGLLSFNNNRSFSLVITYSTLGYLFSISILWVTDNFNLYMISIVTVLTEAIVASGMTFYSKKHNNINIV